MSLKSTIFGKEKLQVLSVVISCCLILFGCASSDVSRDAASNVDLGVNNAKKLVSSATNGNIADTYENASQTTKGAVIGGATGAVTGAFAAGVGALAGSAAGAIIGAGYGSYIDTKVSVKDQLENRGATMVVLGDQILIILPSARLFDPMTANIKPDAYSTLNLVAQYVNSQTKMLVKISAYTDATGSKRLDLALSQQQAESVSKFLTASGIDARVLYAEGYGGTNLVSKNTLEWDGSDNYRIEITLEKLYV